MSTTTHVFTLSATIREPDGSNFTFSILPGFMPEDEEPPPLPEYFPMPEESHDEMMADEAGAESEVSEEKEVQKSPPARPPSPRPLTPPRTARKRKWEEVGEVPDSEEEDEDDKENIPPKSTSQPAPPQQTD